MDPTLEDDVVGAIDARETPGDIPGMGNAPPAEQVTPAGVIDTNETPGDIPGMGHVPAPASQAPAKPRLPVDDIVDAGKQNPVDAVKQFPGNVKRIVSYLMGEGAVDPQMLSQAGAQVDPQGQMSADDRNVLAVDKAMKEGGPEAAWKLMQANRVAFNAKQAFAYAALNGTQQKPPDINAAVDAANQASSHVLDGSVVKFAAGRGGVTATVTGDGEPQSFNLTPDQFRQYLNVGGAGQWDRLSAPGGIPATLQKLQQSAGGATRLAQTPAAKPRQTSNAPTEGEAYTPPTPKTNFGKTPSTVNLSGSDEITPLQQDQTNYGDELEARAMRMFPSVGQEQARNTWMSQQEDRELTRDNAVKVAAEKGKNDIEKARATGTGRVAQEGVRQEGNLAVAKEKGSNYRYASDNKTRAVQIATDQKAAAAGNREAQARIDSARKDLAVKQQTGARLTPDDVALGKLLNQQGQQAIQGQQPVGQAPQQQAPQQQGKPPVPGAKLYKGQWYTRGANGESVPVQ